jgi:RNA polymerase sigma-70 factor, ECF subfamily
LKPAQTPGSGPPAAGFEQVYAQHFAFVWRCLRALGVRDGAVDDAAQEVFMVVHRRLPEFRGESDLKTWLYGITRHVAAHHQRSVRRKGSQHDPIHPDLPGTGPSPLDAAADAEAGAFVTDFVASLAPKLRDVFVLASLEQTSVPEVAQVLSIPVNTAYTRLRAARALFQRALARRGGSDDQT